MDNKKPVLNKTFKTKKAGKKFSVRKTLLPLLRNELTGDVTVKLGGDTSFDVYPKGWDKSSILAEFSKEDEVYFVGDRCEDNGNDKEIFDAVNLLKKGKAFKTQNPTNTIEIIENYILNE